MKGTVKVSRFRKSFDDIYSQLWDILDKPKLNYWDRHRCKQLLNQLLREHHFGESYRPLRFTREDCKGGNK